MIRRIRKSMIKALHHLGRKLFSEVSQKNLIILESKPGFSDNTYMIYKELLRREYNKKYKLLWFVEANDHIPNLPDNVECFTVRNTIINLFLRDYYLQTAKFVISCNSREYSTHIGHHNIHLGHGASIKDPGTNVQLNKYFDLVIVLSDYFKEQACKFYNVSYRKMLIAGYPRCDLLLEMPSEKKRTLVREDYKKVIAWLPTFRKQNKSERIDSTINYPFGIPLFRREEDWVKVNETLAEENCLLIIKYHFSSDAESHYFKNYSHIRVITNEYLMEKSLQLYELLRYTDSLITDYSSVYYEYLLLDKPIGLAIDDLENYTSNRGLAVDYYSDIKGCYLYNIDDLVRFILSICDSRISFDPELERAKQKYNDYFDGQSTNRIINYLEAEYNL